MIFTGKVQSWFCHQMDITFVSHAKILRMMSCRI